MYIYLFREQQDGDLLKILWVLNGFEFVEFSSPQPAFWSRSSNCWASKRWPEHRSKNVTLFRQGDINFILNAEPGSPAAYFAQEHGPSACGMAFRVKDAHRAYSRALELGAQPIEIETGPMELRLPAIKGIGGAPLYLIDRYARQHNLPTLTSNGLMASIAIPKVAAFRKSIT